ncbi:hypothetical protein DYB28_007188 [Aphanomyces astaci]|uniref:Uncharacterized protein n=2 Tax=Aphanomyces astaci TaxID=112090 RepID=A0A396ZWQ4_APHAT|nr:hypothetical protein DYB36_014345 [Aphanomyces astaci]RHY15072.1 hypothetical protein DYB25_003071 [Aphanomyces astaci]RHY37008.1 hypothetical protein DYB38_001084 [Aphanomyces astaci]RHY53622.1 hypothetical protein DYB34_003937 [Aphanomyces astaci]RHZ24299.1 hypothetical protein DYB31_012432 [Aphanomyces astaci]
MLDVNRSRLDMQDTTDSSTPSLLEHILWNMEKSDPCLVVPPIKRRLVFTCTGSEIKRKLVFSSHKTVKPLRPTKRELEREAAKVLEQSKQDESATPYFAKLGRRKRQLSFD